MQAYKLPPQPAQATRRDDLRSVLDGLVDMTQTLAQAVHAQAMAQAAIRPEVNAPEHVRDATAARTATLASAFDRVARCLRRTVLLAHHLSQPAAPNLRTHARARVIRGVEDAIGRAAHEGRVPDEGALRRELLERLDSPALDDDLAARPLPDLIEELCRDLGVHDPLPFAAPPRRRTPADIEAVRIEARAQPGTLATRRCERGGALQCPPAQQPDLERPEPSQDAPAALRPG